MPVMRMVRSLHGRPGHAHDQAEVRDQAVVRAEDRGAERRCRRRCDAGLRAARHRSRRSRRASTDINWMTRECERSSPWKSRASDCVAYLFVSAPRTTAPRAAPRWCRIGARSSPASACATTAVNACSVSPASSSRFRQRSAWRLLHAGQPPVDLGQPLVLFGRRQRVVQRRAVQLIVEILEQAIALAVGELLPREAYGSSSSQ